MPQGEVVLSVSMTETPQFRLLVDSLIAAEELADELVIEGDTRLRELVEGCRDELARLGG